MQTASAVSSKWQSTPGWSVHTTVVVGGEVCDDAVDCVALLGVLVVAAVDADDGLLDSTEDNNDDEDDDDKEETV